MKFLFLLQARMGASRFPGKMLAEVQPELPLLGLVYRRVLSAQEASATNCWVLTSDSATDDPLVAWIETQRGMQCFRGAEVDVYGRFHKFLVDHQIEAEYIVRICCDNPFIEPEFIDRMTDYLHRATDDRCDYCSYQTADQKPAILSHLGLLAEAIYVPAFLAAESAITDPYEREHVTPFFYRQDRMRCHYLDLPPLLSDHNYRFTVDTEDDLDVARSLSSAVGATDCTYRDLVAAVQTDPALLKRMATNASENAKRQA